MKKEKKLKKDFLNMKLPEEQRAEAFIGLQKLPKNSHPNRIRNRCQLSGRPRGYYRKFGLSRCKLREVAMRGEIPGLTLSSW